MLESLFNKVAALRAATLLKTVFSCEIFEMFNNNFFVEHLGKTAFPFSVKVQAERLLLHFHLTCKLIRTSVGVFFF